MNQTLTATATRYGAAELQASSHRFWFSGLLVSVALHAVIVCCYLAFGDNYPGVIADQIPKRLVGYLPQPSIQDGYKLPEPKAGGSSRAKVGVPVPVANEMSDVVEETLQLETGLADAGASTGSGGTADGWVEEGTYPQEIEIEEPPPDFVPVERHPEVLTMVTPTYPSIALRAGLEGKVWVKIWVNKEGKVRDVVLISSDSDVFTEAAIEAARQCVFRPAYMSAGPVAVWVFMPFRFTLKEQ